MDYVVSVQHPAYHDARRTEDSQRNFFQDSDSVNIDCGDGNGENTKSSFLGEECDEKRQIGSLSISGARVHPLEHQHVRLDGNEQSSDLSCNSFSEFSYVSADGVKSGADCDAVQANKTSSTKGVVFDDGSSAIDVKGPGGGADEGIQRNASEEQLRGIRTAHSSSSRQFSPDVSMDVSMDVSIDSFSKEVLPSYVRVVKSRVARGVSGKVGYILLFIYFCI